MPRHGQHKQRYSQHKQRKPILISVPSSSVYDALGLNPRQAPYRSVVGIVTAHSGCLGRKLFLPNITFSNTEPRDMTKVINTLKRTSGFSMLAYHNCIEMISPHNLPFPIAMEKGWAECWENLLWRYRYLYGKPAATPTYMPVLELMFAIYKINEHWRVKKRKTISNDQMAAEEDSAHLKGQSLLVNMGSTSHIEVAPKSKVKFKTVKRHFQQQNSISHIPYEIGAKPDGMYVINGHQVISDAKGTKVISDEYILQALLFAYVFETRFAFIVCQYDEQPTRIFAVDSDVATIKRYRDDHLLRAFDDLMTGLCSLNACAFASNFYDPRNQAIRERTYISMIQSCLPVNLTSLDSNVTISNESKSSFFEDNFTHRSSKFQDFRKNLVTVPSYSFLPPLDVQIVPNRWNELIGIDCFKGCNTHVLDFPEENGLQHCQDICRRNNYGGFCLYGTSAYFRKEPPHLLVQSLCRVDKAVFHLAPISAEKYQHLPDEIKDKKACITDGVTDDRFRECISIAIDHSYSMGSAFDEMQAWCDDGNQNALKKTLDRRSRMDAVKQIFYAFRDRTDTLDQGAHKLGLIQFDDRVEKLMDLESNLEVFEAIVDDVEKRGSTAIYSAIILATKMLKPVFMSSPDVDLRVLLLTDGENNAGESYLTALEAAFEIGAVVDAIIVGNCPDENLRKIVSATGGNCYQIRSLSEGFDLMEAEAVVSLLARRGGRPKPKFVKKQVPNSDSFARIKAQTIINGKNAAKSAAAAVSPPVQPKKLMNCRKLCSMATETPITVGNRAATKRIMKELRKDLNGQPGIHLFPDAANIFIMRALIEGPAGSPFEGGVFALEVSIPQNYPHSPPNISFSTPIYHCNVSETGRLCLDILRHAWTPVLTIPKVLTCIRNLIANPNTDDALRNWIAELTIMHRKSTGTDTRYVDAARCATAANASRSVKEWKVLWGLEE